jgi:hypothetical protein
MDTASYGSSPATSASDSDVIAPGSMTATSGTLSSPVPMFMPAWKSVRCVHMHCSVSASTHPLPATKKKQQKQKH